MTGLPTSTTTASTTRANTTSKATTRLGDDRHSSVTIYSYNPMSANADRTLEIMHQLKRADVITLIGTQVKAQQGEQVLAFNREKSRVFQWGWRRTKFSNKSARITIVLGPRLKWAVRQVFAPPGVLAGRGGGH